jgi:hypothetical protein
VFRGHLRPIQDGEFEEKRNILSLHMAIVASYFQFGNWKYNLSTENAMNLCTRIYGLNHGGVLEHSQ